MTKCLYFGSTTQIHSGACQWMFRMANRMREYGFETIAVLPEKTGISSRYTDVGIEPYTMWSEPVRRRRPLFGQIVFLLRAVLTAIQLAWFLRRENVDVLHVNEIRYPYALLAGTLARVPTVCHVRANFESTTLRRIFALWTVCFADEIICVSHRTEELMFESVGLNAEKVTTLHDGLPSPERVQEAQGDGRFRREHNIPDDVMLVLCLSKFVETKGQDRVVAAAEQIHSTGDAPSIHFAFVGGSVEGHREYHSKLQTRIKRCSNAHFVGFYEDAIQAIIESDLLVHVPRDEDPFPGVVLEAMMAGIPVVGAYTGGIPEQISDGETGVLVREADDPKELSSAITSLANDPSRRQRLGNAAKTYAETNLSPDVYFDNLRKRYEALT